MLRGFTRAAGRVARPASSFSRTLCVNSGLARHAQDEDTLRAMRTASEPLQKLWPVMKPTLVVCGRALRRVVAASTESASCRPLSQNLV